MQEKKLAIIATKGSLDWVRSRVADVVAGVSHAGEGSDPEPDSLPGSG